MKDSNDDQNLQAKQITIDEFLKKNVRKKGTILQFRPKKKKSLLSSEDPAIQRAIQHSKTLGW